MFVHNESGDLSMFVIHTRLQDLSIKHVGLTITIVNNFKAPCKRCDLTWRSVVVISRIGEWTVCVFLEALQQAGRNPSHETLSKYWTPKTSQLNFDDFCEILKCEKRIEETDLLRAFKKMDVNGDGYISHSELEKALTTVSSTKQTCNMWVWTKQTVIGFCFQSCLTHV